jgi:predicted CXXCH cytochrome family protein
MKPFVIIAALGVYAGLGAWAGAQPQPHSDQPAGHPDVRPATREVNCTVGGCHSKEMSHKFQHGPTAVSACDACHTYKDVAAHTFKLRAEGRDLCTFCHINKGTGAAPVSHKPFADGECLKCHDPHGGETRTNLRFAEVNTLCTSCHKVLEGHSSVHKAVTDGQCTACHKAHTAEHAKLLTQETPGLCLTCHEDIKHQTSAKFLHKPATEGDCMRCHTPHASDTTHQLKAPATKLCGECHEAVLKQAQSATNPHSAATDGEACLNCHTSHGGEHAKLMRDEPVATCLACHKETPKSTVAAKDQNPARPVFADQSKPAEDPSKPKAVAKGVPELAAKGMNPHGPVAEGHCAACHDVHGGSRAQLLKAGFSGEVQEKFAPANFELCFSCHDQRMLAGPTTADATNFRDGERNLHHLHVTVRGRACTACHTMHASRFPQQICETVTFGSWQLPINFKPAETGASCAPGCHRPYSYTRTAVKIPVKATEVGSPSPGE